LLLCLTSTLLQIHLNRYPLNHYCLHSGFLHPDCRFQDLVPVPVPGLGCSLVEAVDSSTGMMMVDNENNDPTIIMNRIFSKIISYMNIKDWSIFSAIGNVSGILNAPVENSSSYSFPLLSLVTKLSTAKPSCLPRALAMCSTLQASSLPAIDVASFFVISLLTGNISTPLKAASAQPQQSKSTTIVTQTTKEERILNLLNDLTIKMNHLIKLLENK
jgi:hypothetical protein